MLKLYTLARGFRLILNTKEIKNRVTVQFLHFLKDLNPHELFIIFLEIFRLFFANPFIIINFHLQNLKR